MRIFPSILLLVVTLLACEQAKAARPGIIDCGARESQVAIKLYARKELDIEGTKLSYEFFVLSNKSSEPITVLADLRKAKYWVVHPHAVSLQWKDGNAWVDVTPSLSEYLGPDKKVVVPPNEEWQFAYSLVDLIPNGASRSQEYRLVVMDTDGCDMTSDTFTLESLDRLERAPPVQETREVGPGRFERAIPSIAPMRRAEADDYARTLEILLKREPRVTARHGEAIASQPIAI